MSKVRFYWKFISKRQLAQCIRIYIHNWPLQLFSQDYGLASQLAKYCSKISHILYYIFDLRGGDAEPGSCKSFAKVRETGFIIAPRHELACTVFPPDNIGAVTEHHSSQELNISLIS